MDPPRSPFRVLGEFLERKFSTRMFSDFVGYTSKSGDELELVVATFKPKAAVLLSLL